MALAVPTTQEVKDNIVSQVESAISQTVPMLPKAFVRVLAAALAGVVIVLYRYASFIFLQLFVAHATLRETTIGGVRVKPLLAWGQLIGVDDPEAATQAEHTIEITVLNQTGNLDAGAQLLHVTTGVIHVTTTTIALDAATKQVTVRAVSDQEGGDGSGSIGNLATGAELEFANPQANVARVATVVAQTVTGADAESEESYRARVQDRARSKPQGGAYADYRQWGEAVAGIVHVYPYTSASPGEVDVYAEATEASSGSPDGIPTGAQLQAVFDAIQLEVSGLATRRPANAAVNVLAIDRIPFALRVSGLTPDTAELRTAIEEAGDEYLRSREPYIVGLSVLPRQDRITDAALGGIVDGVVNAAGATVTTVELTPGPAFTLSFGEKAKLGDTTYV